MHVTLTPPHLTRDNDLVAQCRPPEPLPGGGQRPAGDGDPGLPLPQQLRAGQVGGAVPGTARHQVHLTLDISHLYNGYIYSQCCRCRDSIHRRAGTWAGRGLAAVTPRPGW